MAKTKRRQLAALAAKVDGKGFTGSEERIASCQEAGPSGTASHKSDPLVEFRTQRFIIKIPPLPLKPAAITSNPVRRRKRKASSTAELSSKPLPADGAKRNKRKARVDTELKPGNVPADEGTIRKRRATMNSKLIAKQVPDGDAKIRRRRASSKSKVNSQHVPADEAKLSRRKVASETDSKQVPADEAKISKVILKLGKWRREKMIGELPFPVAEVTPVGRQSRTRVTSLPPSRKRLKVQQVLIKSPAETNTEEVATGVQDKTPAENGAPTRIVAVEACSGEPVLSSTNRPLEVAGTCNGDRVTNRASSPIHTFRRKRGSVAKAVVQSPASCDNAEREEKSRTGVLANGVDGVPESRRMRSKKTLTPHPEGIGYTPSDDVSTVRNSKDGATSSRAQAEHQIAGSTKTGSQQNLQLPQMELLNTSDHQDRDIRPLQQTYPSGATEEDCKPLWQMEQLQLTLPFTPGENGVFLVIKKEEGIDIDQSAQCSAGKDVILRGAELIKQNNQLAIINKRLDAAGGLRNWLLDKGLGQFVPIFDDNKIDSLTLLQITMRGLKEMGMIPVGPRRKLMHALSCLTGGSSSTSVGGL